MAESEEYDYMFYKLFYELTRLVESLRSMSEGAKAKSEEENDYQDGRSQGYSQSAQRIEKILDELK